MEYSSMQSLVELCQLDRKSVFENRDYFLSIYNQCEQEILTLATQNSSNYKIFDLSLVVILEKLCFCVKSALENEDYQTIEQTSSCLEAIVEYIMDEADLPILKERFNDLGILDKTNVKYS